MDDLISEAARRGLLDEASARVRLGGRAPTPESILSAGLLTPQQLHDLFNTPTVVAGSSGMPEAAGGGGAFGHYIRERELGRGGFGTVWLANDTRLRRRVALKILKGDDPDEIARFSREARVAAGLSHPNIAAVYEVGQFDDEHYIAMQFVEGDTLARIGLTPRQACEAIRDVARAVAYAHGQGVVHRDLKPHNLMRGADGRVYVLDFGLAKSTRPGSSVTFSGAIVGTPAYMSPEQAQGEPASERSDVYGLGATLYELVSGRPPFIGGMPLDLIRKVVDQEPPPLNVERDIRTIVLKAMDKDPTRRYPGAAALADDLERHLAGEPIQAHPASMWYRVQKRVRKNRALSAAVAVAVVAAAAAAGVVGARWVQSRTELRDARAAETAGRWEDALAGYERSERLWRTGEAAAGALRAREELAGRERERRRARIWDGRSRMFHALAAGSLRRIEVAGFAEMKISSDHARAWLDELDGDVEKIRREVDLPAPEGEAIGVWARTLLGGPEADLDAAVERGLARDPPDSIPLLFRARWNLNRYFGHFQMPTAALGGAREVIDTPTWEETPAMARLRAAADRDLAAMQVGGEERFSRWVDQIRRGIETFWKAKESRSAEDYRRAARDLEATAEWSAEMDRIAGLAWMMAGDYSAAWEAWNRVIVRSRDWLAIYHWRARLMLLSGYSRDRVGQDSRPDYEAAIRDYETLLDQLPGDPLALVGIGESRARIGDAEFHRGKDPTESYRLALEAFDRAESLASSIPTLFAVRGGVRSRLAELKAMRGEDAEAEWSASLRDYERVRAAMPESARVMLGLANARLGLANVAQWAGRDSREAYRACVDDFSATLKLDSSLAEAHAGLGTARWRLADAMQASGEDPRAVYAEAAEDYTRALDLYPEYADALHGRASAHWALGLAQANRGEDARPTLQRSIDDATQAMALNPRHADFVCVRAASRMALGEARFLRGENAREDYREAVSDYTRSLELNSNLVSAWMGRGIARSTMATLDEDPEPALGDAIEDFTQALARGPGETRAWVSRGNARVALAERLMRQGKDDGGLLKAAIADFTEALARNPRSADALNGRGNARMRRAEYDAALADYDAALAINGALWMAHANKGMVYRTLGRWPEAAAAFEAALKINPGQPVLEQLVREAREHENKDF